VCCDARHAVGAAFGFGADANVCSAEFGVSDDDSRARIGCF
jgi:hypothetical protein